MKLKLCHFSPKLSEHNHGKFSVPRSTCKESYQYVTDKYFTFHILKTRVKLKNLRNIEFSQALGVAKCIFDDVIGKILS